MKKAKIAILSCLNSITKNHHCNLHHSSIITTTIIIIFVFIVTIITSSSLSTTTTDLFFTTTISNTTANCVTTHKDKYIFAKFLWSKGEN